MDVSKLPEDKQVPISGNDDVRFSGDGGFQNKVVCRVRADGSDLLLWDDNVLGVMKPR